MWCNAIVVVVGLAGCVSHTAKLGPYVRNIQAQPGGLVVDSCVVQHVVEENYALLLIGTSPSRDARLEQGACWRQLVPTADVP